MRELRWASAVAVLIGTTLMGAAQQAGTQPSTTGLTASPTTATAGSAVTVSATASPVLTSPFIQTGAFPKPGGNVRFFEGANQLGSAVPVTAGTGFTGATFQQTFGAPDPALGSLASVHQLAADLNGDGTADLLLYASVGNGTQTEVQAFLSGSKGYTPLSPQTLNISGTPAVIDENGDGVADLLIGSSISFGNGDGTFQQPTPLPFLSDSYAATYVADVNGDRQPDIVAVSILPQPLGQTPGPVTFVATVFANAGGGAFNSLGSIALASSNACPCAFASVASLTFVDLNGDGYPEMVAQTITVPAGNAEAAPIITVLLNNGNGTYAAASQVTYPFVFDQGALEPTNLLVGDFNEDGKMDLLLVLPSELGLGTGPEYQTPITFLPGNGDGSFGTPIVSSLSVPIPGSGGQMPPVPAGNAVVADANEDGHLDLIFGSGAVTQGDG
ncbi:MAG: FG-GAP-like repeat-containing protein, partial [Acidobacteriaceae bacterium]